MVDPVFVPQALTMEELKQITRSGASALGKIAKARGVTTEAIQRSIWHAARIGSAELNSFAVSAANRLGLKLAADTFVAGTGGGAGAGIAFGTVALTSLVVGALVVAGIGTYYWATTGKPIKAGWRGSMTDEKRDERRDPTRGDHGDSSLREPYGVFLAGNDVLVGQKSHWENRALSSLRCWGLDDTKKVKDITTVRAVTPLYDTMEEAVAAYRKAIRRDTIQPNALSEAVSAEFDFDGARHNIQNAPAP